MPFKNWRLLSGIAIILSILIAGFYFFNNKRAANSRLQEPFVSSSPDKPRFSLRPPLNWTKNTDANSRVSFLSPTKVVKDQYEYRALIGVNIIEKWGRDLASAVAKNKESISQVSKEMTILKDKEITINGQKGHLFERTYAAKKVFPQTESLIKDFPELALNHEIDIFFLKDGYLYTLYATTFKIYWDEFAQDIEASLKTFKFLQGVDK